MKKRRYLLCLLPVILLSFVSCTAPTVPDSDGSSVVADESVQMPDDLPEPDPVPVPDIVPDSQEEQVPEQDAQSAMTQEQLWQLEADILTNVDRAVPDFPVIEFPQSEPYSEAEREALAGVEKWSGAAPVNEYRSQKVIDNYLFDVAQNIPQIVADEPLNGSLLAVSTANSSPKCFLTVEGDIWLERDGSSQRILAGRLPGIGEHQLDCLWVQIATDGQVFWFVYGTQVARVWLPTGRVDSGTLSAPCRMWTPLTRSSLYCQYELADYTLTYTDETGTQFLSFHQSHGLVPEIPVSQAVYCAETGRDAALSVSEVVQMQRSGQLFNWYYTEGEDKLDPQMDHTTYFAADRRTRPFEVGYDPEPRQANNSITYPFSFSSGYTEQLDPYLDNSLLEKNLYLTLASEQWWPGWVAAPWHYLRIAILVDCPLNGHILRSHYLGGSVYLWTDDFKLYRCSVDGEDPQLVVDFMPTIAAAGVQDPTWSIDFAGPTFWLLLEDQMYRVYLPGGECDKLDVQMPEDLYAWESTGNYHLWCILQDGTWVTIHVTAGEIYRVEHEIDNWSNYCFP